MPRALLLLAMLPVVFGLGGCRQQRGYPNRPISLICPWAAGGGTDRVSRQVAALLEQELDVPVNVINATGGAGVTGHTRGALARPDGYTLTMVTVEINMLHWRGLTNISYKDYEPVGMLNRDAAALFVRTDAPWQNPRELREDVRANPGRLTASGTATGGIWHLGLAGWLHHAGLEPTDVIWVPSSGAAPSLQELIAGGVDIVCCSLPEAKPLLDGRRVRCLGVMAEQRSDQFPDMPTFKEQGVDWTLTGWRGICLPKGTPPEVQKRVAEALRAVVQGKALRTFMGNGGFDVTWQPPEEFAATMKDVDAELGNQLTSEAFKSLLRAEYGPMFFPAVLAVLLLLVLAGLLATGGLRRAPDIVPITRQGLVRSAEIVAWVLAYLILAEWAGFVVTAAVLLALLVWRLGTRWPVATALSLAIVPVTYEVFAVWLRVPLPQGWLGW